MSRRHAYVCKKPPGDWTAIVAQDPGQWTVLVAGSSNLSHVFGQALNYLRSTTPTPELTFSSRSIDKIVFAPPPRQPVHLGSVLQGTSIAILCPDGSHRPERWCRLWRDPTGLLSFGGMLFVLSEVPEAIEKAFTEIGTNHEIWVRHAWRGTDLIPDLGSSTRPSHLRSEINLGVSS